MMKRYRNGEIWDFEHEMPVTGDEVVLGLDGGTTSTVCICMPLLRVSDPLPDPLPLLAKAVAGCSNHNSVGEANARETLEQVMAEALAKSGSNRSAVRAVCLAVSGVNHPTDQQRIVKWLREIFPSYVRLYVQNDAVAAMASGTLGKLHGCVLIAGTGTIAYGFTEDGREARAAGAGPILGDWGSGYGIAAQALTAVIRAHDGRGPETNLTSSILEKLGLSSADELIGWKRFFPSCHGGWCSWSEQEMGYWQRSHKLHLQGLSWSISYQAKGGACSWGSIAGSEPLHERILQGAIEVQFLKFARIDAIVQ